MIGEYEKRYGNRFDYVKYDEKATKDQAIFKEMFQGLEACVQLNLGEGRAKYLVLTKLEEAYMWVGKSIRDSQLERNFMESLHLV